MGMFTNYENLQDNYIPNNICPSTPCPNPCPPESKLQPCKPKLPYEEYNATGELIGYWWYYGDTLNLEFNIEGELVVEGNNQYVDASDFLKDKQITVQLFNFRRELIDSKTYAGNTTIIYPIDKELSKKLVRSVYYCSLTVWKGDDLNNTIFEQQDCTLTVR